MSEGIKSLRQEVLASPTIWEAIAALTNNLGREVGDHLETMLCRELVRDRETQTRILSSSVGD